VKLILDSVPVFSAPESLIYFLLNIGDGDAQLLLLPERKDNNRRAVIS
jgi:hypothetical protein